MGGDKTEYDPKAFPLAQGELAQSLMKLVNQANDYKAIRRGANEATKALNRGQANMIIMAADAEPLEVLLHLPLLCEDKNVPYVFIPQKTTLGRSCGISRPVVAVAISAEENDQLKSQLRTAHLEIEKLLV